MIQIGRRAGLSEPATSSFTNGCSPALVAVRLMEFSRWAWPGTASEMASATAARRASCATPTRKPALRTLHSVMTLIRADTADRQPSVSSRRRHLRVTFL